MEEDILNYSPTVMIPGTLCTFQNAFSQAAISQGYFPKWKISNCAISQAATFQVNPSRSARAPRLF